MKRIAIHSTPRSGSTWLGQIFNSNPKVKYAFQPLFSFELKGYLNENSSLETIQDFFLKLLHTKDDFINQTEGIKKGILPNFFKTNDVSHIVYKEVRYHYVIENLLLKDENIKIIGLVRNPLAVIASWLKAPREFRKDLGWLENEEWQYATLKNQNKIEEYNGFEKWKEVTNLFLKLEQEFPNQFLLVDYNDLLLDTKSCVKKMFAFCELEYTSETENFILQTKEINNEDAYSVFKTKKIDNDWENSLNLEIVEVIIKDLKNTPLEKFLHL
mgnify:CR=1 FL=1